MLTLVLPRGHTFGWGVCGKYLARELAKLAPVQLVTQPFDVETIGDECEYYELQRLYVEPGMEHFQPQEVALAPVLQAITDHHLLPMAPEVRGKRNLGYTFFEHSILSKHSLDNARHHFDMVIAGSTWCQDILRQHGVAPTHTIFQGVDQTIFNMYENQKTFFADHFVVFSGGKLEFRKGQDLVIRAFRVLQERHKDVLLVNAWFDHWAFSWRTMAASPYIDFVYQGHDHCAAINNLLTANGIDVRRVITLPAKPNMALARIYKNSDCGLFPNRCEGGTNLALMEYMACGKPAIVSNSSGHRDVAHDGNALMLKHLRPIIVSMDEQVVAVWDDPALDEIIETLEWAYQQRDAIRAIGDAAGHSMQAFSWAAAAAQFYALMTA
jgi:glycosyltransferase involved in cell wall biosynthesis